MKSVKSVLLFGDSLAKGVIFDSAKNRYRIAQENAAVLIARKTGIEVLNRSRMGMTSESGLSQMQRDLSEGMRADAAFVEFGGNDSDFDWPAISREPEGAHLPKTTLETYKKDMREMVSTLKSAGMPVIMTTLPPVVAERYFAFFSRNGLNRDHILHWLGDVNKIYRFHEQYSLAAAGIARELNCPLVDLRAAFLEQWDIAPYFCMDGIHPSEKGQELIGATVMRTLSLA